MLGLFGATSLVIAGMVGSGVLILSSIMAQYGSWAILGWLLSGLMTYTLALTFASAKKRFSEDDTLIDFVGKTFGQRIGTVVALGYFVGMCSSFAIVAVTFGKYGSAIIPLNEILISYIAMFFLFSLNCFNSKAANSMLTSLTAFKIVSFLLIALFGLPYYSNFSFNLDLNAFDGLYKSAAFSMFAFVGVEFAIVSSKGIENPERNVMLATKLGLFFSLLIYVLMQLTVFFTLGVEGALNSARPILDASIVIFGPKSALFISIVGMISCLTTLNGILFVNANNIQNLSSQKWFFNSLLSKNSNFPYKGAFLGLIISVSLINFPTLLKFALTSANAFVAILYMVVVIIDIKLNKIKLMNIAALLSCFVILSNMNLTIFLLMITIYFVSYLAKIYYDSKKEGVKL